ncbi:hypothetical protein K435DRAFT_863916 [Dendrothele bispora CBS 962.96]|uniref:Uncharacterized protein n=1 Tax=Dendrothele bispora (strain CBS 962.96) TaxID=1314807 RepID=A0A4S8LP51_DENBC|nr:hypothetical protein K435DRAFT_863916 [Dendrothele bispora CBS 962.96]
MPVKLARAGAAFETGEFESVIWRGGGVGGKAEGEFGETEGEEGDVEVGEGGEEEEDGDNYDGN